MLSEEEKAAQNTREVGLSVLSTEPEAYPTSVLLLDGPGFGGFALPPSSHPPLLPKSATVRILIGNLSVSRCCVLLKSLSAPSGASVCGFRVVSGMETGQEFVEALPSFLSPSLKASPCFCKILQLIIRKDNSDGDCGPTLNEAEYDNENMVEKYNLFGVMKENMGNALVCSAIAFVLAVLSIKRPSTVAKSSERLDIMLQALHTYKEHPQICLHMAYAIDSNALAFLESEEHSKTLFTVLLDVLTGGRLDVVLLNVVLSILGKYNTIDNNDKLVRFVVALLRNENEAGTHEACRDEQRKQAVKGLLCVLNKISKNEGGPYLIMYAGGVELLASALKKAMSDLSPGARENALESIFSIVSSLNELSKNDNICISIVRSGALPPLFKAAEALSADPSSLAQCCSVVKACSQKYCDEVADDFAKSDGVRIFTELLSNSFDSVELASAICSIFSDVVNYESVAQKTLECNAIEEVIRAMDRHCMSTQFCEVACTVLIKLTGSKNAVSAEACEAIVRANGVASILWALERHQKISGMLVCVSSLLANVTKAQSGAAAMIEEDGITLLTNSFCAGCKKGQQAKSMHSLATAMDSVSQVVKNVVAAEPASMGNDSGLLQAVSLFMNVFFKFVSESDISFSSCEGGPDVNAFKNHFLEAVLESTKSMTAYSVPVLDAFKSEYCAFPLFAGVLDAPTSDSDSNSDIVTRKRLVVEILCSCASAPGAENAECGLGPDMIFKVIAAVNSCSTDVALSLGGVDLVSKLYERNPAVRAVVLKERKKVVRVLEVVLQKNAKSTGVDVFTLFGKVFVLIKTLISASAHRSKINLEKTLKVMAKVVYQVFNAGDFASCGSEWESNFYKVFLRILLEVFGERDAYETRTLYRYSKVFRVYDGIDFIVKTLKRATKSKARDVELSFIACSALERLLFDYENQQKIVSLNGISIVVNALSSYYGSTDFFVAACKVLQILALDEKNIKEIIDLHIIETITDVTRKTQLENPEFCAASCSTLANITFASETAVIASECEGMELAIQILRRYSRDHGVIRGACALIANLSLVEENVSLIVEYGLVHTLASLLGELRKEGVQQADLCAKVISALTNITKFSVGKEEFVESCNGVRLFSEMFQDSLLRKEDSAPVFDGIYSVFANVVFDERYIKRVVNEKFVGETIELLNHYLAKGRNNDDPFLDDDFGDPSAASSTTSSSCCCCCDDVSSSTDDTSSEWYDDDDVLGGYDDKTAVCNAVSSMCAFLTNISIETEYQVLVAWKNGIPPIVDSLGVFSEDSGVCDKACALLRNLSLNSDNRREITDNGGIHRVLSVLERHTANPSVCTNACGVLANVLLDKSVAALAARENTVCTIAAAVRRNICDPFVCERGCAALLLLLRSGGRLAVSRANVCTSTALAVLRRLVRLDRVNECGSGGSGCGGNDGAVDPDLCDAVCGLLAAAVTAQREPGLRTVLESNPWITEEYRQIVQRKSGGWFKWW